MLGRRALATAALTSKVIADGTATLAGRAAAGISRGLLRPVRLTLAGTGASAARVAHGRPVGLEPTTDSTTRAATGLSRRISATLSCGAESAANVSPGVFAKLAATIETRTAAGTVRRLTAEPSSHGQTDLTASQSREIAARVPSGTETSLRASSASWITLPLCGRTTAIARTELGRQASSPLAGATTSALRASHYTPGLIRLYGPVAAEWDRPRILVIWADMLEEGDITMKDKAMIAGTNAAKVVRLYPDDGDLGGNGITLEGCHSFVAKAKRVDGTGPVVTLGAIIEGDPTEGRIRLDHTTDAFTPGLYEIQIRYRDGADYQHAYPDDGESLRLEVKAAL